MYINRNVGHIYVINLEHAYIRRNYIIELMEKYNINFELIVVQKITEEQYNCVGNKEITIGETGCYLSHMYCLNDASTNNYKNIIIFEDDIIFHKQFHKKFENLGNLDKFDFLMLGAADFAFYKLHNKDIINKLYKPKQSHKKLFGCHGIFYSNNGIKKMYNFRITTPTFFDHKLRDLLEIFRDSFYICFPNLVIAELSTTSLEHNFSITNSNLTKEQMYYTCCFKNSLNFNDYNYIYLCIFNNVNLSLFNPNKTFRTNIETLTRRVKFNISLQNRNAFDKTFDKEFIIEKMLERMNYEFFNNNDLEYFLFNKISYFL
jgi:GR25 family glycosyltransferase involved in LPS biosynthesis